MKVTLYWVTSSKATWLDSFINIYEKKINSHIDFNVEPIKTKKLARAEAEAKVKVETQSLSKKIHKDDFVIVFDEQGVSCKDSKDFSRIWVRSIESGKKRVVLIVGGAFGLGSEIKNRADKTISLSAFTLSHQLAVAVSLEQIYRAIAISKNLPYHNE